MTVQFPILKKENVNLNSERGLLYEKASFNKLDIDCFFTLDEYQIIDDFIHADISGIAKVCGYQILFFYILGHVEVLSLEDVVENTFLRDKANQILTYLGFDFKMGHPFELTDEFNHNFKFKDSINDDEVRYYYDFNEMLIVLGINWQGFLVSFEMVKDKAIIHNRLENFYS